MKTVVSTDASAHPEQPVTSSELRAWWAETVVFSLPHTSNFNYEQEKFWCFQASGLLQEEAQQTFPLITP